MFHLIRENIERADTSRCLCCAGMIHDSITSCISSLIYARYFQLSRCVCVYVCMRSRTSTHVAI
jgi:hypothetical protein